MTNDAMIDQAVKKIQSCSDETLQTIWDNLCASFFLADTAKKAELIAYPSTRQRAFLQEYAKDLLKGASYIEAFWRFVVNEEQFTF